MIIGPNVLLRASDHIHERTDIPIKDQGHSGGVLIVGDDVWIGAHSIIAAGSVLTSNVEPYSVFAGVPAKLIRKRN